MDFLPFFLGYVGIFGIVAVLVLFANSTPYFSSVSDRIKQIIIRTVHKVVPTFIINLVKDIVHYVFNTRNHVMQFMFGILVVGGNVILMMDVMPLLYIFEPEENHMFLPMVFLFVNLAAFHLSCATDPGHITSSNVAMLASLYKADGIMFKAGSQCSTCKLAKPARSKHCSICNRCVHRFDHHCIWTNNCVGAGNLRWFFGFLWTLVVMVVNGAVMGTRAMMLMVQHLKIMDSGYVDPSTGNVLPVTIPVMIQHLFMQHPRCVFLISSLFMLTVLLGLFTLYHTYLLLNNQTTNERYKIADLPVVKLGGHPQDEASHKESTSPGSSENKQQRDKNGRHLSGQDQKKNSKSSRKQASSPKSGENRKVENNTAVRGHKCDEKDVSSFYNKGLYQNICEVLFPWSDLAEMQEVAPQNVQSTDSIHKRKKR
ncbi:palmitoyltransferase ZDHHC4 [Aplysia californica]|uniref:Palmitoyltransferase n=1 Tax=Aplysia californica TaxID=6500 RepID=A0ABM0JG77_APLCA|nr:palmitoyltransferase ZDHHC4 [Aplysia californica]